MINGLTILFILTFIIINIFLFSYDKLNIKNIYDIFLLISIIFIFLILITLTIYINIIDQDIRKISYDLKTLPSKNNKIHMNINLFWFIFSFSIISIILFFVMLILLSEKKLYKSIETEIFYILISICIIIYIIFLTIQIFIFNKEHKKNIILFNKHKNKINLDNITNFKNG